MSNISFFHIASLYPKATDFAINRVRIFHPDSYYFLASDGIDGYESLAEKYNTDFIKYDNRTGGPIGAHGYRIDGVLEFLNRFKTACERCNTSHIMMMEDDVYIKKEITVDENWELACHYILGNGIHSNLIDEIEKYSGFRPKVPNYSAAGGSIFKVSTFLNNFDRITEWFKNNLHQVQTYYPTLGWIDCFMAVYFYLCGKDYVVNPYMVDTHVHRPGFNYEYFLNCLSDNIQIINNYKKYYYPSDWQT
jgi:hypothetical protein